MGAGHHPLYFAAARPAAQTYDGRGRRGHPSFALSSGPGHPTCHDDGNERPALSSNEFDWCHDEAARVGGGTFSRMCCSLVSEISPRIAGLIECSGAKL